VKDKRSALSHPAFFNRYVEMVGEDHVKELLAKSYESLKSDMDELAKSVFEYTYAEDKWSIQTLIRHCIDAEIIFMSRALSIARNDNKPIRSFNENEYAKESIADYEKDALIEEFLHIRKANVLLFKSFDDEWLASRKGKTENGDAISLLSIAYIIIGHWLHHKKVLSDRYGIDFKE
jgi:hypothetical protein